MIENDIFYVRPRDVGNDSLTLSKDEAHHLLHVHRKKRNDLFAAVDGKGTTFDCQIDSVEKDKIHAQILKRRRFVGEPVFKLTLALAIPKKARFEWVIEKGTEIGVSSFIPLITNRTIATEKSVKLIRWKKIALVAMKQCKRSILPTIETPVRFESFVETPSNYDLKLLAHENELDRDLNKSIESFGKNSKLQKFRSGILCIGPEGGFTSEEVKLAQQNGFSSFVMGPRRLRSETAALVSTSLILNKMGEL